MKNNCKDCGREFEISLEEVQRFREKKMTMPKRCRACRRSEMFDQKLKVIRKILSRVLYLLEPNKTNNHEQKLSKEQSERVESQT